MIVKHFEENTEGDDYVVGDVHGCFKKLEIVLAERGFDETKDRLFSVGDLVDRGPDSEEALAWLRKPWFHAVKGNHEQMAIDYGLKTYAQQDRSTYRYNGGQWMIDLRDNDPEIARHFAQVFDNLPLAIEIERGGKLYGIVHADVPTNDWQQLEPCNVFAENAMLWGRNRFYNLDKSVVENVEFVYVGHTPLKHTMQFGNVVYMDTGACFNGMLTVEKLGYRVTEELK